MILENPNATTLCSALVSFFIPVIISVIIYLGQGYEKKNPDTNVLHEDLSDI